MPRLIVALDAPKLAAARAIVQRLGEACDFYKVGSELFTAEGPAAAQMLRAAGKDIFLDLKLHDIPNTVRGAARSAAALGATLLTVHASGGRAMMEAAVEGAGKGTRILAVSVLTSLDAESLGEVWGRHVAVMADEVLRLADLARAARVDGIVCGGAEAPLVRARHGSALSLLVPGIRLPGAATHDQARSVTPAEAVAAGATYLVLGRIVTEAEDPKEALSRLRAGVGSRESGVD